MTTFTINPRTTPDPTGFTVTGTVGGVTLKWTEPSDDEAYGSEVWVSSTNDRNAATKLADVAISSFYHELPAGSTRYYWLRGKNMYGNTTGNWVPASATAGKVGVTQGATTTDIAAQAVNKITITSKVVNTESNTASYPMYSSPTSTPGGVMLWKTFTPSATGSTIMITVSDNITYGTPPTTTDTGTNGCITIDGGNCGLTFYAQLYRAPDVNNTATDVLISEWGSGSSSNIFEWIRTGTNIIPKYLESQPYVVLSPYSGSGPVLVPGTNYRIVLSLTPFGSTGSRAPGFTSNAPTIVIQEIKR